MNRLTDEGLARMVSDVAVTMLGNAFMVSTVREVEAGLAARTALITVGEGVLTVGLSCNRRGLVILCAALMAGTGVKVDDALMDDSLRELANMTAGRIKRIMCPEQRLGLPRVVDGSHPAESSAGGWRHVRLRAGTVEMVLWLNDRKGSKWDSIR
jgi:hypothetical protein